MTSAASWLDNENLWVVAVGILAFVGTLIGARAAWRAVHPRHRLLYGLMKPTPLLATGGIARENFSVTHGSRTLRNGHVLRIELTNLGRKDIVIPDDQSFSLALGDGVVALLDVSGQPGGRALPPVTVDGTSLKLGRGLVPSRHTIFLTVLMDNQWPRVHGLTATSALPDVVVAKGFAPDGTARRRLIKYVAVPAVLFLAGVWVGTR
ncbi:hypothetical protein [Streptomyces sp. NPDC002133]|uniref:hypothetical protein n=1 Tax=Streptomyces sp. NPDC002133 TaxID=3154409 RepID=UPI00331F2E5B